MVAPSLFNPWQSRVFRLDRKAVPAFAWQLATLIVVFAMGVHSQTLAQSRLAQSSSRSSQYNPASSPLTGSQSMSVYPAPRSQVPHSQVSRVQASGRQASPSQAVPTRLASTVQAVSDPAGYRVIRDRQPATNHLASLSQPTTPSQRTASAQRIDGVSLDEAALKQSTIEKASLSRTTELPATAPTSTETSATDGFPDLLAGDEVEQTKTSFVDGLLKGDFATGPMVRTGSALLIVLSVFIGLIYGYRKLGSKGVVPGRLPTDLVQHLGSTVVDQGIRVSFIQLADRIVVVGQRANGDPVTLTEITDPVKIQQVVNRCMGRPQIVGQRDHGPVPQQPSISSSLEMAIR